MPFLGGPLHNADAVYRRHETCATLTTMRFVSRSKSSPANRAACALTVRTRTGMHATFFDRLTNRISSQGRTGLVTAVHRITLMERPTQERRHVVLLVVDRQRGDNRSRFKSPKMPSIFAPSTVNVRT